MPKKEELKYSNVYPFIGIAIALIVNVGALFWWGGVLTTQMAGILKNQDEQRQMWLKIESRLGTAEIKIAVLNQAEGIK